MFYSLTGKIVAAENGYVALLCGGVAFKCNTSLYTLKRIGTKSENVTLFTYMSVREDAIELFGFDTQEELECFKMLISVNGVGPKAGLAVLSELSPSDLALCIVSGDSKQIKRAQGVGPKIAQRIVLELKDKIQGAVQTSQNKIAVNAFDSVTVSDTSSQAVTALEVLGYSRAEASAAVAKAEENLSVEEKIKFALKLLARG